MLHFLGFLLIIILALVLIGFGILMSVVRGVFRLGKGGRGNRTASWQTGAGATRADDGRREERRRATVSDDGTVAVEEGELHINRKKIFGKDEGEYVSYEEVKE